MSHCQIGILAGVSFHVRYLFYSLITGDDIDAAFEASKCNMWWYS